MMKSTLIIVLLLSIISCSLNPDEIDYFDCSTDVNDSVQIRIQGDVSYFGFNDVEFSREIKLVKGKDSININLGKSEFRGVLMKRLQIDSLKHQFIFYNRDDSRKVIVDFTTFEIIRSKSILDSIRDPHKLEGEELILCEIPGTY